ncbi:MAG: MerR family transcriptional regulator [Fusobacteriaceae bacterium]|jgi:MerR family transcriptional regulator, aldehyde-responsive regulator|nr:MerR family transcriptional regulator [Fusobacteriaceae bacterium]MBP6467226.1 MerR family transcriptional regulator [Fusobacteriaceae bacterium]MBP9595775.1 MerR family transcriptional regulator [Fusobacteriaceae bacterium]
MTITEISQRFGITTDTIRYYERIKLIPPIKRNSNGIRNFTEEDCNWVYFIKQLRSAGISIETLVEYVSLFQEGISTVGARKELLIEQLRIVENRMKEIQETYERLKLKVDGYEERILVREEKLKKFNEGEKE